MTPIDPDDPKWTAYVLGELDDQERAAVELELAASEEARILVEELRMAAEMTRAELRDAVVVVPLSAEQREKIHSSVKVVRPSRWFITRPVVWATGLAAASIATIAVLNVRQTDFPATSPAPAPQIAMVEREKLQESDAAIPVASDVMKPQAVKDDPPFKLKYEDPPAPIIELKKAEAAGAGAAAPVDALAGQAVATPTSQVFGTVQDAAKANIPGVTLTATNTVTGTTATAVTNETGAFAFQDLQPGQYRLSGSLAGFQTQIVEGIQLDANAEARQDMTLQVASVGQSVEVGVTADGLQQAPSGLAGRRQESQTANVSSRSAFAETRPAAQPAPAPPPPPAVPLSPLAVAAEPAPVFRDQLSRAFNDTAESYDRIPDNPFIAVAQSRVSTFSVDVDTASFSDVRRFLNQNLLPPRDAVRIEEMINYFNFSYDHPRPANGDSIGASIEAAAAPWNPRHRLVRIAINAVAMAEDVNVHVEFNPAVVDAFRLIGYERSVLRKEDFKSAADLGAGQTVTVLYQVVPRGAPINAAGASKETLNVKIQYKEAGGADKLLEFPLLDGNRPFARASLDFRFAASVAAFGLVLRDSPHKGNATMDSVLSIAKDSIGSDRSGSRREFLQLVQRARQLKR